MRHFHSPPPHRFPFISSPNPGSVSPVRWKCDMKMMKHILFAVLPATVAPFELNSLVRASYSICRHSQNKSHRHVTIIQIMHVCIVKSEHSPRPYMDICTSARLNHGVWLSGRMNHHVHISFQIKGQAINQISFPPPQRRRRRRGRRRPRTKLPHLTRSFPYSYNTWRLGEGRGGRGEECIISTLTIFPATTERPSSVVAVLLASRMHITWNPSRRRYSCVWGLFKLQPAVAG